MNQHRNCRARQSLWALLLMFLPFLALRAAPGSPAPQNRPAIRSGASPNTSYLAGMPSVEKVEQLIQGSDPTDTLARQVAVFNLLPTLIQRMGMDPSRRYGDTTPDEQKLMGAYSLAAYQLTQDYAKSHTADELKAFNQLHGRYELDDALSREMFQKLFTKEFLDDYSKVDAAANAHYKAHIDQETREAQQAQTQASGHSDRDEFFAYLKNPQTVRVMEILAIPYFLPTIYLLLRGGWRYFYFVFLFNLLFAWTGVMWFGCWVLVHFCLKSMRMQKNANQTPPPMPPPASAPPALPYCPRCGAAWTQGAQLCSNCGATVA